VTDRIAEIRERRNRLVTRSDQLRGDVGRFVKPWRAPVSLVNRVLMIVRRIRENPMLVPLALVLLMASRRSGVGAWIGRLVTLWQLFQSVPGSQRQNPG